jgi:hypothetical protein
MASDKLTIVYTANVKSRTVVKVTASVCLTIFACRIFGQIATPHIRKMTRKMDQHLADLKSSTTVDS